MSKPLLDVQIRTFIDTVNKQYKGTVTERAARFGALKLLRFSSGSIELDMALGGGIPFSRIMTIAGEYSTGKTLLSIKACQSVERYCHNCHRFGGINVGGIQQMAMCTCKDFTPGSALYVDVEGAFDFDWAIANGFNKDYHSVARPEAAEHAIDIIDAAIRAKCFDLIIIDSVAAMTPSKEIEVSTEEWQMGLAARLNNKAFRKWNASLNKISQENPAGGPTIISLNQIRTKMVLMGDPRTLPGGKGQEFCSSIIVYTKNAEYDHDEEKKEDAFAQMKGVVKKNKTYVPKLEYQFSMALSQIENEGRIIWKKGEIDNAKSLMKLGEKHDLIKKIGDGWGFDIYAGKTKDALESQIKMKPEVQTKLWRELLRKTLDQVTV